MSNYTGYKKDGGKPYKKWGDKGKGNPSPLTLNREPKVTLNPDDISAKVKDFVFKEFANEQASQLKELCSRQIAFILQQFDKPKGDSPQDLKDAITATVSKIDVDKIYAENKMLIDDILSKSDYQRLLFIYNRKSLSTRVSTFFGLANNKYPSLVLNLLKTKKREEILRVLRTLMPTI